MKANLTLFYSTKVYLNLVTDQDILEIDQITTKYTSQDELRESPEFKNQIDKYYVNISNYRNRIENPNDKKGKLYLTYYDQNNDFRKLRVLYSSDKAKLDPLRVINSIKRALKKVQNNSVLIKLFNEYSFIFDTEYNNHRYKLARLKRELSFSEHPGNSSLTKYNTLVKIVYDELVKGYDRNSKTTTPNSYYHIRLIDEYLEQKVGLTTTYKNKIKIVPENIHKIAKPVLLERDLAMAKKIPAEENKTQESFHGMGDYYLEDDEAWHR